MYEALYASVPDADAYLERIHRKRRTALTKEYLDDLIYGHQIHVPFENLDVWMFKRYSVGYCIHLRKSGG